MVYFLFINTINFSKARQILAYSGGFDSSWCLEQICQSKQQYKYLIGHYVHNQRPQSEDEIIKILILCINYNITLAVDFNCNNIQSKTKLRQNRYKFLFHLALISHIHKIILCHTLTDNLENMIMKEASDNKYEIAMPYIRSVIYYGHDIEMIRPMLSIPRALTLNTSPIIDDPTNYSQTSIRTQVRYTFYTIKPNISQIIKINKLIQFANDYEIDKFDNLHINKQGQIIIHKEIPELYHKIKTALFALNNSMTSRIKQNTLHNIIFYNISCCLHDCSIQSTGDYLYISKLPLRTEYQYSIHSDYHNILLHNLYRLEVIATSSIIININSKYEIYIVVDQYKISINLYPINFRVSYLYTCNTYIILILHTTSQIKWLT